MKMQLGRWMVFFCAVALPLTSAVASAQVASSATQSVPEWMQQAQTLSIPLVAYDRKTLQPVQNLAAGDLQLQVEGKAREFQLQQAPAAPANMLIILPFGGFQPRRAAVDQAIDALNKGNLAGWNISILDDAGNQTAYTRNGNEVKEQLQAMSVASPVPVSPDEWRTTASLAIAGMRDLSGRRVVLTLGDIFHTVFTGHDGQLYEAYAVTDVADAARNAGAIIYAAESAGDLDTLHQLAPNEELAGSNPWLLTMRNSAIAGWICDSVADTLKKIQQDGSGFYEMRLHLEPAQMDGQVRPLDVRAQNVAVLLQAPGTYVAPDRKRLQLFSTMPAALREALQSPGGTQTETPLELETQLAYFPHADGKTGTQVVTTGYFWNAETPPPAQMTTALQLQQTRSGFIADTITGQLHWTATAPVWTENLNVEPGAYILRVAAADATGKISGSVETPFTVASSAGEPVLASSLVLGKACTFVPPQEPVPGHPDAVDILRAGNCEMHPDPTHYFSPEDVLWTLVRVTPTGKLAGRPAKDWKASFALLDADGNRVMEEKASLIDAGGGSYAATTAIALSNPKLKLTNGQYAVGFQLKGPGIDEDMVQVVPITIYNVQPATAAPKQ